MKEQGTRMAELIEIAPDVFRICTFVPEFDLQFSQFLVRDEEPLLFHTGLRKLFPGVREAVAKVLDPSTIRWIGFSHFEADECGSLNEWLTVAPNATAVTSLVGALVSVDDVSLRPARPMNDGETFSTGRRHFRFCATPHVPHCWEASVLFEETTRTLFCSDLLDNGGDRPPVSESLEEVLDAHRQSLTIGQSSPFANYFPWTPNTEPILSGLARLEPAILATMHGSVFRGDGARAIEAEIDILRDIFGHATIGSRNV